MTYTLRFQTFHDHYTSMYCLTARNPHQTAVTMNSNLCNLFSRYQLFHLKNSETLQEFQSPMNSIVLQ